MHQDEIDKLWSGDMAKAIIEKLAEGKILKESDREEAEALAAEQIRFHLTAGDRPEPGNFRYLP